jgi:cyclic pyranopterin phosphate synthase
MDVGTINHWQRSETVPAKELVEAINARWPIVPAQRNYHGEVASRYMYADGQGELGFINSVSEPFCGSCTRARLSSDGKLFTCLFAAQGLDLRAPLRDDCSDEQLAEVISGVWRQREDRYSELRARKAAPEDKVEMYYIGG